MKGEMMKAGTREDRRTGQFVPTVDGKDTSPTSFSEERAMSIAEQAAAMSAPKWTPGPWKPQIVRYPNGQLNGTPSVYAPNGDDGGRHVCACYDNGQIEANARLIAAAPSLADFVRAIARCVKCSESESGQPAPEAVDAWIEHARALLARLEAQS